MLPQETNTHSDTLKPPELDRTGKYALLSVSDKTGICELAETLVQAGYHIIATGGTATTLSQYGIEVVPVESVTRMPEGFDGRVKTLSHRIEAGILFDRANPNHIAQADEAGILNIDFVVVNLYPFEETVQHPDSTNDEIIENIDVGGPTIVRSAAKNNKHVTVIVDPRDYKWIADTLIQGEITPEIRKSLAAKAFHLLSYYDAQIARHLSEGEMLPEKTAFPLRRVRQFRYGENPHQTPSYAYIIPQTNSPLAHLQLAEGNRDSSHTNYTDIDAGLQAVRIFEEPAACIIKHNTPCGIALGDNPAQALERAMQTDPKSAFGGVAVLNCEADMQVAEVVQTLKDCGVLLDIIAAPGMSEEVGSALHNLRKGTEKYMGMAVYTFGPIQNKRTGNDKLHYRAIEGGILVQPWDDDFEAGFEKWTYPTVVQPTDQQIKQAQLAWKFISRIRSNATVVVDATLPMTRGIGTGQTARIFAAQQALRLAGNRAKGGILVSDAFFPFNDCVKTSCKAGIALVVQSGGSKRDQDSIDAADASGIPMICTGTRAFWH